MFGVLTSLEPIVGFAFLFRLPHPFPFIVPVFTPVAIKGSAEILNLTTMVCLNAKF